MTSEDIRELQKKLSLSLPIIKILIHRGYRSVKQIKDFLSPSLDKLSDPFLFRDMDKATDRIIRAIRGKEPIIIYGDYDVDGTSSIALLVRNLQKCNSHPFYYVPHRLKEGYGLSKKGLRSIKNEGFKLIITVDCGINAVEEIQLAEELGIDVIVTDHHTPKRNLLDAFAVINPKRDGENYPYLELSGVGVAFKLIDALFFKIGKERSEIFRDLDLVALGTIADVVPLNGENRILAKKGIDMLNKTEKTGLLALIQRSGLKKGAIGAYEIGFILGPRLNASGRLDSAVKTVEILLTEERERAWEYATILDKSNKVRQELHGKVVKESIEIIKEKEYDKGINGIVLAKEDWHEGVVGIAASKIAEKYSRPTILISTAGEFGKGSGRSIKSFSILDALERCKEYLIRYGGHRYAVGITIDKDMIPGFRTAFNNIVREQLKEQDLVKTIESDCELTFKEIDKILLSEIKMLEPFGVGNKQPIFLTKNVDFVGYPRIVGKDHLKIKVREDNIVFEAIGFGQADAVKSIEMGKKVYSIFYHLKESKYRNRKEVQLHLLKIEKLY
ncbi:single-stranded-DNA-specific exonuclease RecJ [candidate division WOR-3 bacterium]|nr:single-stranded-DNA-specific exonuclease RecJ [candidate division WOR-3 bacterium]